MRVEADTDHQGPACRLVAEALGVEIAITGLSAGEMRYRLEGQGEPWRWADLVGHGPITVSLATDPIHEPVEGAPVVYERDLPDGEVRLVSGGRAEFRVESRHDAHGGILPYCFHAAVAQQLARAGVLTLHAATVIVPQGGILAIGRKGAGKSTLTASALKAGLGVVTDDWVLAGVTGQVMQVERMRDYMMWRKGWAIEQLKRFLPADLLRESSTRPRFQLWLPEGDPRFPGSATVAAACVLERPASGRREQTRSSPIAGARALGSIMESSMPLVLSERLPVERSCLLPRLIALLAHQRWYRVEAGTDLVEHTQAAWHSLLATFSGSRYLSGHRRVDGPRRPL
ncbi:hypothetical protein [Wenzhouxiangella sp. EGI_FJ10305]|uniref:hypothetical protein n=1 Tax=Wenzhouxiangella sp. EGI_FJ10305 TaxID=3243768 RepID=UPI0035E2D92D